MNRFKPPGPALDEIVAVKVLGWEPNLYCNGMQLGWVDDEGYSTSALPKFSTTMCGNFDLIRGIRYVEHSFDEFTQGVLWVKQKGKELNIWDTAEENELQEFLPIYNDSVYWISWIACLGALKAFVGEDSIYNVKATGEERDPS